MSTVKRWESGERVPHGALVGAYARYLASLGSSISPTVGFALDTSRSRIPGLFAFYRRRAGLTLRIASAAVGLSPATLHRIEVGVRPPEDEDEFGRLCGLYGCRKADAERLHGLLTNPLPASGAEAWQIGWTLNDFRAGKDENDLPTASWIAQVGDSYAAHKAAEPTETLQCLAAWQSALTGSGDWELASKVGARMVEIAQAAPETAPYVRPVKRFRAFTFGLRADVRDARRIAARLADSVSGQVGLDAYDGYLYAGRLARALGDEARWGTLSEGLLEAGRSSGNPMYESASRVHKALGDDQFRPTDRLFEVCAEVDNPDASGWTRFLAETARFQGHCRRRDWGAAASVGTRLRAAFETRGFGSPVLDEALVRFPELQEALEPAYA